MKHRGRRAGRRRSAHRRRRLASLPPRTRIAVFLLGWLLILVGVAGLVLPGIQGVVTLVAGAAVLSLVSEITYNWLRLLLARWPRLWRKIEAFRLKVYRRLAREQGLAMLREWAVRSGRSVARLWARLRRRVGGSPGPGEDGGG